MKKKLLIIFLFILFAIPIPFSVLGGWSCLYWLITCQIRENPEIEGILGLIGIIVASTYIMTYLSSLNVTRTQKKISLKTFMPIAHCLLAVLYLLTVQFANYQMYMTKEYFEFKKKDFSIVEEQDTHGGFHGDGDYYFILDCSSNKEKAEKNLKSWKKLPMSENLSLIMYGGVKDGVTYGYELAENAKIPKIENGYYNFEDRHLESTDSTDDTELFNRYSYNFSIAVYDCDTDRMYYYEYDT